MIDTKENFKQFPATQDEEKIIEKVNDLFITYRKKYIWQNKDGSYTNSSVVKKVLTDTQILNHIRKTDTIGIFCGEFAAKFILFDVDMKENAKIGARGIKRTLIEIGIPKEYIYTVFSGNKGYHIIIFFDALMPLPFIDSLYNYILLRTRYSKNQVELRPKFKMGVKLPLSKHKVTGNLCLFVDDNFNPIDDKDFILGIHKFSKEIFIEIVRETEKATKLIQKENEIKNNYKQPEHFRQYKDKKYTIDKAESLIENGLQHVGSRHNSLILLAIYFNTQGYGENVIRELLYDWMNEQDRSMYSTPIEKCIEDIDEIVSWVTDKDACLADKSINISIYDKEIEKIMELPRFNQQILMYALLCHSKRYATSRGVFYATRRQLMRATRIKCRKTITRIIDNLERLGFLKIVSRGVFKKSNKYKVLIRADENIKENFIAVGDDVVDFSKNYVEIINKKFTKKELRNMLKVNCYRKIAT